MGFQIVLVNDKDSQSKIRRHLRDRQSELRRKKLKDLRDSSEATKAKSIVGHGPLAWRRKPHEDALLADGNETTSPSGSISSQRRSSITSICNDNDDRSSHTYEIRTSASSPTAAVEVNPPIVNATSPVDVLCATRRNPFNTYPIASDVETERLFDIYIHSGPYTFDYPSNPNHDLFIRQAGFSMHDEAAFHAMMLFAAVNDDRRSGRMLPGMRSLHHRIEAVKLINERLDSPDPAMYLSESTMYTVSRLHVLEKHWKAIGDDEVHTSGVHKLLVLYGGLHKLSRERPALTTVIYLSALVTPGMLRSASPALYGITTTTFTRHQEQEALARELLEFLEEMTAKGQRHYDACALVKSTTGNTGPICRLLTASPSTSRVLPEHTQSAMLRLQNQLRLACTIQFHLSILSINSQAAFAAIVDHLRWILTLERLWRTSLRLMHYLLIQDPSTTNLGYPELVFKVLRLTDAVKLLPEDTQESLRDAMLGVLSGVNGTDAIDMGIVRRELAPYLLG